MPIANVRVPFGAYDADRRRLVIDALTDAIADAEQIPDDPTQRARIIVIWEELVNTTVYANGLDTTPLAAPVFVDLQPPAGALTEECAAAFVAAVDSIFVTNGPDDGRFVTTSVIVSPVADGNWGIGGRINHIADFARTAGYRHLQHLVR